MRPGSSRVQNPFKSTRSEKPFLSPLGRQRALPAIAAPLALTAVGGIVLVVAFGALFGIQSRQTAPDAVPAGPDVAAVEETVPEPAASAPAAAGESTEEPASLTALPEEPLPAGSDALPATGFVPPDTVEAALPPATERDRTAAIPRAFPADPTTAAPDVPVAETDDEIAALEERQAEENREVLGDAAPEGGEENAAVPVPAGMRPATVTSAVNLRAGPDNDAEVVKVLPERAAIQAEADCGWCRVSHDGTTGYVYKSFIEYR